MQPWRIFQYRYQNIDFYDNTTMFFISPNFESISYTELPRYLISSSPAVAAAFPDSDIRVFIGPFTFRYINSISYSIYVHIQYQFKLCILSKNYDLKVTKSIILLNLYLRTSKSKALKIYSKKYKYPKNNLITVTWVAVIRYLHQCWL